MLWFKWFVRINSYESPSHNQEASLWKHHFSPQHNFSGQEPLLSIC